ncbi:MAG TPA: penicillin-binding protein 2, partial [Coxiellaceae bacterium]|nr:penicillin-binding protein 2 [Coxiellaceae bacterium]
GRLMYLQLFQHARFSTLSQKNLLTIIPLAPNRGLIFDRNEELLAQNTPSINLAIIPKRVENLDETLTQLQTILSISDEQIHHFKKELYRYRPYQPVPLRSHLNDADLARFYVNAYRFPGVIIQDQMIRYYPGGHLASHALGHVGRMNLKELQAMDSGNYSPSDYVGKAGVEKIYESLLHGKMGIEEAETDVKGRLIRVLNKQAAIDGAKVYLTLDAKLQAVAEASLEGEDGSIIAMDPGTGEILAYVSKPDYDPNLFVAGLTNQEYQTLMQMPNHPLFNRPIRSELASGSTIKPFYALQGLNIGAIDENFKLFDPGFFKLPHYDHVFHDWRHHGHGWVDVVKAITVSCDIFFYHLALNMGIDQMDTVLKAFGFGDYTGIDLPSEAPGIRPSPEWKHKTQGKPWYPGDTVNAGIGQGFIAVTPIQLARAVSTIAMRGISFKPHLLKSYQLPNESTVNPPLEAKPPITIADQHWNAVIEGMRNVIVGESGTGWHFGKNAPYSVAAKTGTAQVSHKREANTENEDQSKIAKNLRDNDLFISFAPIDHPQIVVVIVVEHTHKAAHAARQIMDYYLLEEKHWRPS